MKETCQNLGALCVAGGLITSGVGLKSQDPTVQVVGLISTLLGTTLIAAHKLGKFFKQNTVTPTQDEEPLLIDINYAYRNPLNELENFSINRVLEIRPDMQVIVHNQLPPDSNLSASDAVPLIEEKMILPD